MPSDSTIHKMLTKAKEASKNSTYPQHKIGAVLVYGNKILAIGFNTCKTNPAQKRYNLYRNFKKYESPNNGYLHAEGLILIKTRFLDINWSKTTLYIYRQRKDGSIGLAKPCPGCQIALEERGIEEIYYTDDKSKKGWSKL